jgi:hypothetical protein
MCYVLMHFLTCFAYLYPPNDMTVLMLGFYVTPVFLFLLECFFFGYMMSVCQSYVCMMSGWRYILFKIQAQ